MGMIIQGTWSEQDQIIRDGAYVRPASAFDDVISDGVVRAFTREPGRYHLVASLSCQWSHRTLILHRLKGLESQVPIQLAHGPRLEGYAVNGGDSWRVPGSDLDIQHLHQLYTHSDGEFTGRSTVPVLWDSQAQSIVSNSSAAIMRAFDAAKPSISEPDFSLRPESLREEIDALNAVIHDGLANGVYRAGFAESQDAYDLAVGEVFDSLDDLEKRLASSRYLFGNIITEADWRLFPTLVRFDNVYYVLHKCARRRLVDYPVLWAYTRDLFAWRGVKDTVDFGIMRHASYTNDTSGNANRIVAIAPDINWSEPHGRDDLGRAQVALRSGAVVEIDPKTLNHLAG
jgi:putative glutathione S-transferase